MRNKNKNNKVKIENNEEKDSTFFIKIDKNNKDINDLLAKEISEIIDIYAEYLGNDEKNGE